ncbi:glycosyltransferase family 2 protein [Cetobacterium ceti]
MCNEKLVSILIPTYNVEKYITKSLESILKQTYKNLEIIVVDDFSEDNTVKLIKKLMKNDKRIKLFQNNKNLKICKTLNIAFQNSHGDYIVRMDGDDECDTDRIEKQIEFLNANKEIALVGMSVKNIDEDGYMFSKTKYYKSFSKLKKMLYYDSPVLHIWACRREVYDKLNGYRDIPYVEDYDFLLRMLTYNYKFSNLENYYGYSVRFRRGNTITTKGLEQIKAFEYALELYKYREKNRVSKDNFSEEEYLKKIYVTEKEKESYSKTINLLENFFKTKNNIKKIILIIKILFSSKIYLKKIRKRLLFKIYGKL